MANVFRFRKRPLVFFLIILLASFILVVHQLASKEKKDQLVIYETRERTKEENKLFEDVEPPAGVKLNGGRFHASTNSNSQSVNDTETQHHIEETLSSVSPSRRTAELNSKTVNRLREVNYCVHAFYYPWYGNEKTDGNFVHWNHPYIKHWNKDIAGKYPDGKHTPPDDIGASFYPLLGPYSSRDQDTIAKHMEYLTTAGIGVIVVSWLPRKHADANGRPIDSTLPVILNTALAHNIKVALHFEPYEGRTITNIRMDIEYVMLMYADHPALFKYTNTEALSPRPVVYLYDSYLLPETEWARLFTLNGDLSVRETKYDIFAISLLTKEIEKDFVLSSGFDGFYTYFATDGFTYGSSMGNWRSLATFAARNKLVFIPSVGPGYDDTRVRPWNSRNTRKRSNGEYYIRSISHALDAKPKFVSITSFNEWHEGTQIEPAIPKSYNDFQYQNYLPQNEYFYLKLTYDRFKGFCSSGG